MIDYKQIEQIPVPLRTESYTPVPHMEILNQIEGLLSSKGLNIVDSSMNVAANGQKLTGFYSVRADNAEFGMMIAFRNSYDKSMTVGFANGINVFVCGNGVICGDISSFRRKHMGSIDIELHNHIEDNINKMEDTYTEMLSDIQMMKEISITKEYQAKLLGKMFVIENIVNSHQLGIIKSEINNSSFECFRGDDSLWTFYNNCTFALKKSHPIHQIHDHIRFHKFIKEEIPSITDLATVGYE